MSTSHGTSDAAKGGVCRRSARRAARVRRLLAAACLLAGALLGPGLASAQTPLDDTADGDPDAQAERGVPEEFVDLEKLEVHGDRVPGPPALPGVSEARIDLLRFEAEGKGIDDLLASVPGVQVRRFGGPGERFEISVRGSTAEQVLVRYDGIELNTALTGRTDLAGLCVATIDSLTVTRGPTAARSGAGAIGGVLDVGSLPPDADPETRIAFRAGDYDTYEGSAVRRDRIGQTAVEIGYCGLASEGDFRFQRADRVYPGGVVNRSDPDELLRINNERERHSVQAGISHPLGGGALEIRGFARYASQGEPGPDEGAGAIGAQQQFAHQRDVSELLKLGWTGPTAWPPEDSGIHGELETFAYHRYETSHFDDPEGDLVSGPIDIDTRLQTVGVHAEQALFADALDGEHRLSLAADWKTDVVQGNERTTRSRRSAAVLLETESHFLDGRVGFSPALRLDGIEGFGTEASPSLSVALRPLEALELRASAGRSFRPPNFDELFFPDKGFIRGNPDLDPEEAWNVDVGLGLELDDLGPIREIRATATWYRSWVDDSIVLFLINPSTLQPSNTGEASIEGFELELDVTWTSWLRTTASRTTTDAVQRTSRGPDPRLPGRARSEVHGRIELGPPDLLKLVGEVHYAGEIRADLTGAVRIPSRITWDASAALNLAAIDSLRIGTWLETLWISASVTNLTDQSVRDALFFPQPGRYVEFGVETRW